MNIERIAGVEILSDVWLAEVKAMALIGVESSKDVLKLLDAYSLAVAALRHLLHKRSGKLHGQCKKCQGQEHHWDVKDSVQTGELIMACRHCDAARLPTEEERTKILSYGLRRNLFRSSVVV